MGIDTSMLAFPKTRRLRVEAKRDKRLTKARLERECRAEVWRRYGRVCGVPGCKERAVHQHHLVYRSQSKRLAFEPTNRVPLCAGHHQMEHAGKIHLSRKPSGELIVTGARKDLEFKL